MGPSRAVIYSRVSTKEQTTANQTLALEELAVRNGWSIIERYIDEGISGVAERRDRPAFDRLLRDMRRRRFDVILVWDVSRLGRSLKHLLEFLNEVIETRCDLVIYQQGLDTSTAAGRAMFQMVGVFAEFEREMISERVKAGMTRAKAQGKPIGRPILKKEALTRAKHMRAAGASFAAIFEATHVSRSSFYRSRDK